MNEQEPTTPERPLARLLRLVDRLLTEETDRALAALGADRRDWMLLTAAAGDIDAPWLKSRLERGGRRVRALVDRGWLHRADGAWTLTEEGRDARERLRRAMDDIRARAVGAVPPSDYATLTAGLEAIARELGWDGTERPVGDREHRPWPPFGKGFGGHRHGHRHGFAPADTPGDDRAHRCGHRPGFAGTRHGHGPEDAYERGFAAGFARGQAPASDSAA
jgi:hypothetical protein